MALKKDLNKIKKNRAEDNLNYATNKMLALNKSRIRQLLELKDEAISNDDFDKVKEIESELFLMRK
tara:strand:- start:167 stop:364 length:198 start_codon:yes stop_codon:yes gene_type:complete